MNTKCLYLGMHVARSVIKIRHIKPAINFHFLIKSTHYIQCTQKRKMIRFIALPTTLCYGYVIFRIVSFASQGRFLSLFFHIFWGWGRRWSIFFGSEMNFFAISSISFIVWNWRPQPFKSKFSFRSKNVCRAKSGEEIGWWMRVVLWFAKTAWKVIIVYCWLVQLLDRLWRMSFPLVPLVSLLFIQTVPYFLLWQRYKNPNNFTQDIQFLIS